MGVKLDPIEAEECLKLMVFCIDTREQPTENLAKRMEYLQPNVRETAPPVLHKIKNTS